MTRPGIEPRSPGPLANTLTARPMSGLIIIIIINNNDERTRVFRKIYLSHFILERVAKVCVRGEFEMEQTATY